MKHSLFFKLTATGLIYFHLCWTTIVLAETQRPAGVVTSLTGEALLTRAIAPDQPLALKFRDDVFFQDRIRTKAHSIVRVLLGGKAVVTVRALSDLTLSEEPQQPAVVNLVNGKIALDVARSRMKPGEAIEVHTPNAIAAVRGTMIIVEVLSGAEQAGPGHAAAEPDYQPRRASFAGDALPVQAPTTITNFHVLQGSIDISALGKPGTPPVTLSAGFSLGVTGTSMGQPHPSPPVHQLTNDLKTTSPHAGTPEETKQAVSQTQQTTALALAEVLAPKIISPPPPPPPPPPVITNVVIATTDCTTNPSQPGCNAVVSPPPPPPPTPTPFSLVVNSVLDLGTPLATFSGGSSVAPIPSTISGQGTVGSPLFLASPLLNASGATIPASGTLSGDNGGEVLGIQNSTITVSGDDLIAIGGVGALNLAGPLLSYTGGTLFTGFSVLFVEGGTLTSTTASPLLNFTNVSTVDGVDVGSSLTFIDAFSNVSLQGSLLNATNSNLSVRCTGECAAVAVTDSQLTTSATTAPLINLSGGSLTLDPNVRALALTGATVTLSGPLFRATGTTLNVSGTAPFMVLDSSSLTVGGPAMDLINTTLNLGSQPVILLLNGSTLTTTAGPALRMNGGSLTADSLLSSDGAANNLNVTGGGMDLTNATVTVRLVRDRPTVHTDVETFTLASEQPFNRLTNSTLTVTQAGESIMPDIKPSKWGPTFQGVALIATGSTLTEQSEVVDLTGPITITGTNPLIQLTGSTLDTIGYGVITTTIGGTVTLAKPLLSATNSTINTANPNVNTVTASVPVGTNPIGVAVSPNGASTYVANNGASTVSVINTATNTVVATVSVGSFPEAVAVSPNGATAYVANGGSSTVSVINTATNTVIATVPVGAAPLGVAVSPNGATAYVANFFSNTVSVINTATNTVAATVPVGSGPIGVAVSPNGATAYVVNNNSNTVSVINTATNTVTATVPVGSAPYGVAVSPNGATAYVVNNGASTVSVINTATNTVTATVPVGSAPRSVAVSPNGATAYVANGGSSTVSVINTATNTVIATVPVGAAPLGVAVSPNGASTYVVNFNSSTVSVLDTNPGGAFFTVGIGTSVVYTGTAPLVQTTGGTLNIARAIFDFKGSTTAPQVVATGDTLTLGTDRPLSGTASGPLAAELLEASGTTITTNQAVKLDTALLEATAPLINMLNGATMTTNSDLIKLVQNAQMNLNVPGDALIKLNASTLNVTGSLFNVAGGSYLNVTGGSLFSLNTGSTLTITGGALVTVSGGSVFSLASGGSLGLFGTTGTNTLTITNASLVCSGNCVPIGGGFQALLVNGALPANVSVNSFTPFGGAGTVNVNVNGVTSGMRPVLVVSGATSKVKLGF